MLSADRGSGKPPPARTCPCVQVARPAHAGVRTGHETAFFPSGPTAAIARSPSTTTVTRRNPLPVPTASPVLVLGAGPGLGLQIARRFGRAGHPVVLTARGADRLD